MMNLGAPDTAVVEWILAAVASLGLVVAGFFFRQTYRYMLEMDQRFQDFKVIMTARVAVLEDRNGIPHRRADDRRELASE